MSSKIESEKASPEMVGEAIKKASAKESADVLIYVGPTVKQLTRYASFVGGKPAHLKEHFENCKVLEKLFIKTKDFATFEQNLTDANSVEMMLFKKIQDYFSEVK
ncbi:hypothetical protein ACOMCU_24825 [Lysinibacillus sp. UGB7]|uniref:hypothetical protein n=1 Tax=Lysinibacillus sp. UGB7 TaxID=3411039 RepID=UPI003B8159FB